MAQNVTGPVSEIVYIPLKTGFDVHGADKAVLHDCLGTIASQKGLKALFWGIQIEHPDVLQMIIDWESIDFHRQFEKSEVYAPFLSKIGTLQSGDPKIFHARLPANEGKFDPRTAKVTECIALYFDPEQDEEKWITENFNGFTAEAAKVEGLEAQGINAGWSVERHQHEKLGEGVEGKLLAAFIGWPSVESHMKFRETEDFKKVIPYLRQGPKGMSVHHVAFERKA